LGHRGQAVGRAGGVGDHVVLRRVVVLVVHAHDEGRVLTLGRCGDDDLLRARLDVLAGVVGLGEVAGRLDDVVDAQVAPAKGGGVTLGQRLDGLAVVDDLGVGRGDLTGQADQNAVVLSQVAQRGVTGQYDDIYDLVRLVAVCCLY